MNLNPRLRLLGIGAVLSAAALGVTLATGALAGSHPVSRPVQASPAAATSTAAPTATPTPSAPNNGIDLAAAERLASRTVGGRVVKAAVDDNAATLTYDVTVLRADGTDVDVTVDGRSGQVVLQQQDGQDTADQPQPNDSPDGA